MKLDFKNWRIPLALGLTFLVLAFTLWAGWQAWNVPYDGFVWSNMRGDVKAVAENGPAFGRIEPDDLILALDGAPLPLIHSIYLEKRPGDSVVFSVERQEKMISIPILLTSPPGVVRLTEVLPFLVALAFWGTGICVLSFQGSDQRSSMLFLAFCLAASAALAAGGFSATGPPIVSAVFRFSLYWLVPLGFSFHRVFSGNRSSLWQRRLERILYFAAVAASLASTSWIPASPVWYTFHRVWLVLGLSVVVFLLLQSYRDEVDVQYRRQVGIVVLGGVVALLLFLGLSLLPDLILNRQILPYKQSMGTLILIPLSYGYAILHFRLIPLVNHVNRRIASIYASILLLGLFLFLSIILTRLAPPELWKQPLGILLLMLIIARISIPLTRGVGALVDRLFYGPSINHPNAVLRANKAIRKTGGNHHPGQALVHALRKAMQLESIGVFLAVNGHDALSGWFECEDPLSKLAGEHFIASNCSLVRHFQVHTLSILAHTLRQELEDQILSPVEAELLASHSACYWIPIYSTGKLSGILVVGAKLGNGELCNDDLETLQVIAQQTGIALENTALANELQQRNRECARLHRQALLAKEEERKRLSWELHDQTIQSLSGVGYRLAGLRRHLTIEGQGLLNNVLGELQSIIGDLRNLCADLRPPPLDTLGLAAAVRYLVRTLEDQARFRIVVIVEGENSREQEMTEEVNLCIYRCLQEALLNAKRHSQAHQVLVRLRLQTHHVNLEVQDDGRGFTPPIHLGRFSEQEHFGLMGIQERVEMLGGTLAVESAPKQGCRVSVFIPLPSTQIHC